MNKIPFAFLLEPIVFLLSKLQLLCEEIKEMNFYYKNVVECQNQS